MKLLINTFFTEHVRTTSDLSKFKNTRTTKMPSFRELMKFFSKVIFFSVLSVDFEYVFVQTDGLTKFYNSLDFRKSF